MTLSAFIEVFQQPFPALTRPGMVLMQPSVLLIFIDTSVVTGRVHFSSRRMSSCLLDFCEHLLHGSQKSAPCVSYV